VAIALAIGRAKNGILFFGIREKIRLSVRSGISDPSA
jgi:hypothetical protein